MSGETRTYAPRPRCVARRRPGCVVLTLTVVVACAAALLLVACGGERRAAAGPPVSPVASAASSGQSLRIALLHLAPHPGDIDYNTRLIGAAVREAARRGADWCVTPELALSGYGFRSRIGLRWIDRLRSPRVAALARLARRARVCLFVGTPTRDAGGGVLRNSVVVVDSGGDVLGAYHKRDVIPGAVEGWARPGGRARVFTLDGVRAGVLVCADAWPPRLSRETSAAGADSLVSPACWAPGQMGPHGVWERDSRITGLPLLVCNTTGKTAGSDQRDNASVVDDRGRRLFTFHATGSTVFLVDWDRQAGTFARAGSFSPAVR